jgi:hypothetical protein
VPLHKSRSLSNREESLLEFYLADDKLDPKELKHVLSKLQYNYAIEIKKEKKILNLLIYNLSS